MRRIILGLMVLALAISGVAATSAYEAHLINVKAHVENAMEVDIEHIDFGTVFPEEWFTWDFQVMTSDSFCGDTQWRVTHIDYCVYLERKPIDPGNLSRGYYPWLGDALYVGIKPDPSGAFIKKPVDAGGNLTWVGAATPNPAIGPVVCSSLDKGLNDLIDLVTIGLDVPVFREYYNQWTDVDPKASGLSAPTVVIEPGDTDRYFPDGVDLGADLKIQIHDIYLP